MFSLSDIQKIIIIYCKVLFTISVNYFVVINMKNSIFDRKKSLLLVEYNFKR